MREMFYGCIRLLSVSEYPKEINKNNIIESFDIIRDNNSGLDLFEGRKGITEYEENVTDWYLVRELFQVCKNFNDSQSSLYFSSIETNNNYFNFFEGIENIQNLCPISLLKNDKIYDIGWMFSG